MCHTLEEIVSLVDLHKSSCIVGRCPECCYHAGKVPRCLFRFFTFVFNFSLNIAKLHTVQLYRATSCFKTLAYKCEYTPLLNAIK